MAGHIKFAGDIPVNHIAGWDGTRWHALGTGLSGDVRALTIHGGELIAAGGFSAAGDLPVYGVAAWDGSRWRALGDPTASNVLAAVSHDSKLFAARNYMGPPPWNEQYYSVARWDGSSWERLASGSGAVFALDVHDGALVAGGFFSSIGGVTARSIAKWDGNVWSPLGAGIGGDVRTLFNFNGNLIVAGDFSSAGDVPARHVAIWNGTAWRAMSDQNIWVTHMAVQDNKLIASAYLEEPAGGTHVGIAGWDGASWRPLGEEIGESERTPIDCLTTYGGSIVVGGQFGFAGTVPATSIARWDGASWHSLGTGTNGEVTALEVYQGELVAAGGFSVIEGVHTGPIARWDGRTWRPAGQSEITINGQIRAFEVYDGELVAAGRFTWLNGLPVGHVARWNGLNWEGLGGGVGGQGEDTVVEALTTYQGNLIAGGYFTRAGGTIARYVARWDGTSWNWLTAGSMDRSVFALAEYSGQLIAGGNFYRAGYNDAEFIARWSGVPWQSWQALDGWPESWVFALAVFDGELIAAGSPVLAWNGSNWRPIATPGANGSVHEMIIYNGELVAAGGYARIAGLDANGIARWNGEYWSAMGEGLTYPPWSGAVYAVATYGRDLWVGGSFLTAGGRASAYLARWGPVHDPCDANCDGSLNQADLQAFIAAVSGETSCSPCAADANLDGSVNQFDIEPFLGCLDE